MVRSTLVTAWFFADWPTRTSPFLAKATTDGVVREPSEFAMTVGSPPSRTVTTELVVPRSIPTARAMGMASLPCAGVVLVRSWSGSHHLARGPLNFPAHPNGRIRTVFPGSTISPPPLPPRSPSDRPHPREPGVGARPWRGGTAVHRSARDVPSEAAHPRETAGCTRPPRAAERQLGLFTPRRPAAGYEHPRSATLLVRDVGPLRRGVYVTADGRHERARQATHGVRDCLAVLLELARPTA
jgi:hypothetical protein